MSKKNVIEEFNRVDAAFETFRNNLKVNNKIANCIELDLLENLVKEVINNYEKYQDSQQDLINGKDEYIAKLRNDRAELKDKLNDLEMFARIMASRIFIVPRLQDSMIMFYDVDKRHSETEFDLVKKVVEKYGKKED